MIRVENLTKRYGRVTAVDDVTFEVPPGSVTGFLGPNGAGKSTVMRMLTGLTSPTSGRATVLGRDYRDLVNPGGRVGVMLDASAQHPGRTGREALTLTALTVGVARGRVDDALHLVGLTDDEASRRVRTYSLGMRQRLGLAGAFLGEPEVLVLDEPANGLDPQGIHWMRTLLRGFADRGGAVLLSSHLLHEVQAVADEIVVIGRGRVVASGSMAELVAGHGSRVRSEDDVALAGALEAAGHTVTRSPEGVVVDADPAVVGRTALASGCRRGRPAPARCAGARGAVPPAHGRRRAGGGGVSTATQAPAPARAEAASGDSGRPGVPFARLLRVELRKLTDTRAGRWLLVATGGIAVVAVVAFLIWGEAADATYAGLVGIATLPLAILLPILGIMTATAEWSQRTGLVTFALEPHRGRVVLAKLVAAVALGLLVVAVAAGAVAVAHLVGSAARDVPTAWGIPAELALGLVLALTIYLVQGVAFGLVFLNTPVAIVASILLPTAFSIVSSLVGGFERVAVWLDLSLVTEPLTAGTMAGSDWAHLATAAVVWIGVPLGVGTWRVVTKEIA